MSFYKTINRPLRYTLQYRDGRRWHTAKTYTPGKQDFDELARMLILIARQAGPRHKCWRILLMPFNVLAAEADATHLKQIA